MTTGAASGDTTRVAAGIWGIQALADIILICTIANVTVVNESYEWSVDFSCTAFSLNPIIAGLVWEEYRSLGSFGSIQVPVPFLSREWLGGSTV